jgi:hypothetical protein
VSLINATGAVLPVIFFGVGRAVARTKMGGFWTNRFVENGFYLKRVSLGLGNLENGLEPGITRVNF